MIQFQRYLYKKIGYRVKTYRTNNTSESVSSLATKLSADYGFSIDRPLLSNIENGTAIAGKNRYLFSTGLLEGFCTIMEITREQLIFGNTKEKEQLIKLTLLTLLMNGDTTIDDSKTLIPFIEISDSIEHFMTNDKHYILDQLFHSRKSDTFIGSENIKSLSLEDVTQFLSANYPFFSDESSRKDYLLLTTDNNPKFVKLSNLLIKLLFGSLDFATDFIERFRLFYQNQDILISEAQAFLQNKGVYGSLSTDWTNSNFYLFVNAFNNFWARHKKEIMAYFEEELFDLKNESFRKDNIMWNLTDEFFHELITSKDFEMLLENLLITDEYSKHTMIGHNYVRNVLQSALMIDPSVGFMNNPTIEGYDLNKFNSDMQSLTRFFERIDKDDSSKTAPLPLFVSQYAKVEKK